MIRLTHACVAKLRGQHPQAHCNGAPPPFIPPPQAGRVRVGARRCSNLGVGGSRRRSLAQPSHVELVTRKEKTGQAKWHDEQSLRRIAKRLGCAHRHQRAIPVAIRNWHFLWTTRHVFRQHAFRHRHRSMIGGMTGDRHACVRHACVRHASVRPGDCGPCNRSNSEAENCQDTWQDAQQAADAREAYHPAHASIPVPALTDHSDRKQPASFPFCHFPDHALIYVNGSAPCAKNLQPDMPQAKRVTDHTHRGERHRGCGDNG